MFIAGYHPVADARHSICLPSRAIDGDNYTAMFARLRTVSIFPVGGDPRVHSTYSAANPLARRNTAVEFSINNVSGKLRRKTGGRRVHARHTYRARWVFVISTFTPRARNLTSVLPRPLRPIHSKTRVNAVPIYSRREEINFANWGILFLSGYSYPQPLYWESTLLRSSYICTIKQY